jgi:hypothetical protein
MVVQVEDEVTEEEGGKQDDDRADGSDQRKQRTAEVGGQPTDCPDYYSTETKTHVFRS